MKNKILKIALLITLITLIVALSIPKSLAITPGDLTGEVSDDTSLDVEFVTNLENMIRLLGTFIAVGVLMIIGIKYMTGSIEEKANYKKTMMPYLIGCIFLFGASIIAPQIIETFKETKTAEDAGNTVLGLIQTVGTFAAVAVLMILGIKYMLGSIEERASYKKSMLPYLIGAILLFGAVNITAAIANNISEEGYTGNMNSASGRTDAEEYVKGHSASEIYSKYEELKNKPKELEESGTASSEEINYWRSYINVLYEAIRWTYL